jgi:hypothetical protein
MGMKGGDLKTKGLCSKFWIQAMLVPIYGTGDFKCTPSLFLLCKEYSMGGASTARHPAKML